MHKPRTELNVGAVVGPPPPTAKPPAERGALTRSSVAVRFWRATALCGPRTPARFVLPRRQCGAAAGGRPSTTEMAVSGIQAPSPGPADDSTTGAVRATRARRFGGE